MPSLIENDFPFAKLSTIAERESWRKEVYRPVYYLHKWWARRLGSVFRGIILGASLDESADFWEHFYGSNDLEDKVVFDPFMGSGVTLGEALKLRCKVVGRDINPVANVACEAAFTSYDYATVMSTYDKLQEQVAPTLQSYFQTYTVDGETAEVLYYFLVKFVSCPHCTQCIDLFKSRIFSKNAMPKKDPSARSCCPQCGEVNHARYDAHSIDCDNCSLKYNPQCGNIKGAEVNCNHCNHKFRLVDRMKTVDGPLPIRRFAKMVLMQNGKKRYEKYNQFDQELEQKIAIERAHLDNHFPSVPIESGYNTNQIIKHNYHYWHQLFSDRQLVCIRHLIDGIRAIEDDRQRLLFATLFSGTLEFNSLFASFKGEGTGAVRHMFSHHILKPEMMPIEANLWGTPKSSGSFSTLFQSRVLRALRYKADPFELMISQNGDRQRSEKIGGINQPINASLAECYDDLSNGQISAYITSGDSSAMELPDQSVSLVVTDPPFFDNVHYSQLADYFYYWLNQILDISRSTTTRSTREVQDTDVDGFTRKLTSVFAECHRVLLDTGLFIFTYHHARHEGWLAVHQAIRDAGFICTRTYPIKAEMSVAMPLKQAKSPIHLDLIIVCRKNLQTSNVQPNTDSFQKALEQAKEQIVALRQVGIKVSSGDARVILMGQFLCHIHTLRDLEQEKIQLIELENGIEGYIDQIMTVGSEVLYNVGRNEIQQLSLFEKANGYES